ncbi:MAG: hypothetical protein MSG64_16770 [Pyrinomonadaceae bacterium MAG19_C2-C3]|nr:hypothetical protein [Pyrinomonadaceae bacterium MAG19_C2-C3]
MNRVKNLINRIPAPYRAFACAVAIVAALRRESALKDERIAKLEKRKGGSLKEKIITTAIGVGIGAILK